MNDSSNTKGFKLIFLPIIQRYRTSRHAIFLEMFRQLTDSFLRNVLAKFCMKGSEQGSILKAVK